MAIAGLPQALAAMKLILPRLAAAQPSISIQALAAFAVEDHIRTNGCEFEDGAAMRAVALSGIDPETLADDVSHDDLMRLGDLLEDMETNCPHKSAPAARCLGVPGN